MNLITSICLTIFLAAEVLPRTECTVLFDEDSFCASTCPQSSAQLISHRQSTEAARVCLVSYCLQNCSCFLLPPSEFAIALFPSYQQFTIAIVGRSQTIIEEHWHPPNT